jgi:putative RNA ligase
VTHLGDLLDLDALSQAKADGYVREQHHPILPLSILNYTEKAQYERAWNEVTRTCRGIIVDPSGYVVARPFAKFFNYSEHPEGTFVPSSRVVVTDKLDGSLGILYPTLDGHAIATRGSFTSEQAVHATRVWRDRYAETTEVEEGTTWLFEIIYPGNRIVCDYGDTDDLILLGGVDIASGTAIRPGFFVWDGPAVTTFDYDTLGEALAAKPRPGAEGIVVRFIDLRFDDQHGTMVKIKQDDYVRLHRLVTGLNARVVWEAMADGKSLAEICEPLPDELHDWVKHVAARLVAESDRIEGEARAEHDAIFGRLPDDWTRKDFAVHATRSPHRAWLFMLLDGKDPGPKIWQTLRPSGEERPVSYSEDTA